MPGEPPAAADHRGPSRTSHPVGMPEAAIVLLLWFYSPALAQAGWTHLVRPLLVGLGTDPGSPEFGDPGSALELAWTVSFWTGLSVAFLIYLTRVRQLPLRTVGIQRPDPKRDGPLTVMLALVAGGVFAVLILGLLAAASFWPAVFGGLAGDNPVDLVRTRFGLVDVSWHLALYMILLAPVIEELWFRGWLQPALGAAFGAPFGIVACALLFAFAHGLERLPVAQIVGGLVFGIAFERSRNLVWPILLHMLGNASLLLVSWWAEAQTVTS